MSTAEETLTMQAGSGGLIIDVPIVRLPHAGDLPLPAHSTGGSAGLDLRAAVDQPLRLEAGQRAMIPTGFAVALPPGFEGQIRPRSGLARDHGVTVLNAPGTIDSDYRGEIAVLLINHGQAAFTVERGARIAQIIVAPVARVDWRPQDSLDETGRGAGGFGSTGV